jgi:hypothetical protein
LIDLCFELGYSLLPEKQPSVAFEDPRLHPPDLAFEHRDALLAQK